MSALDNTSLTTALAVLSPVMILLAFYGKILFNRRGLSLPPGPKGWPIIGSVFNLPDGRLYEWAAERSKIYGKCVLSYA